MSTSSPTGGMVRIGDRERDQATECLREHMATGRLDPAEFEQRIEAALRARYADDLRPLFVDLPAPWPELPTVRFEPPAARPIPAPAPAPKAETPVQSSGGWKWATVGMWVGAIALCATVSWHLWWLLLIPLLMGGGCGRRSRSEHRQRRLAAQQAHWDARREHFDARVRRFENRHW
ncbi:MAG: DUF1707 domain-containing protein [Microlunatus sp.]|nr:DUF1707 domain-containing protein [Microlunatus sp.]